MAIGSHESFAQRATPAAILPGLLLLCLAAFGGIIASHALDNASILTLTDCLSLLFATAATISALVAARASAGRTRQGWLLLTYGTGAWAAGELLWAYFEVLRGIEAPFPSAADIFYLGAYPLVLAGILKLTSPARPVALARTLLDATVVSLVLGSPVWLYVIHPLVTAGSSSPLETGLGASYPFADMLLVFGLAVAALRRGTNASGLIPVLLSLGLGVFLAADLAFAILSQKEAYATGSLPDMGWLTGYTFISIAAVCQSRWQTTGKYEDAARTAAGWRQAVPVIFLVPAIGWYLYAVSHNGASLVVTGMLMTALVLVGLRSILSFTDITTLNREVSKARTDLMAANLHLQEQGRFLNKLLLEAVELARRDSLTGLLNHGAVLEELSREIGDPDARVVVAMLDINDMKRLNDQSGHQAGDKALREVADRIKALPKSTAGRYGGDEFLIFSSAMGLGEFEGLLADHLTTMPRVSVSWGIASFPADAAQVLPLVNLADERLYAAKAARRVRQRNRGFGNFYRRGA